MRGRPPPAAPALTQATWNARCSFGFARACGTLAIITRGDSRVGRAVALAFAREGADLVMSYLSEHEDAEETKRLVEGAGKTVSANRSAVY